MTNNDILRRIRYAFDFSDVKMTELFALGGLEVTRDQIGSWLKKEEDPAYKNCSDTRLSVFLNGFIIEKRGKKDELPPKPEKKLSNNIILRKLKIALNLKSDDVLYILALANLRLSQHELSAFFRKPGHQHYRECKDQVLRHFLTGLQLEYRENLSKNNARQ